MPQDVRTDAFVYDPSPLAHPFEEHLHPILGEWHACLREKEVILPGAAPLGQFLLAWAMPVQVVEQVALAGIAHGDAPLLGALAGDRQQPMFAVKIAHSQPTQLRDADARIVEQPENGAIARDCPLDKPARFALWSAGL